MDGADLSVTLNFKFPVKTGEQVISAMDSGDKNLYIPLWITSFLQPYLTEPRDELKRREFSE